MSFYLGGGRKHGEGLRRISRGLRTRKECGKTGTLGLTQVGLQAEAKLLELFVIYTYRNNKDETDHKTIRDRKQ